MSKLIKCSACESDFSKEAEKCPKCGHPNKRVSLYKIIFGVLAVIVIIYVIVPNDKTIENMVANDAVKQYDIAKNQGDKIQICVQAGLVSASYLQAQDETNYRKWKDIESQDCARAGMPKY